MLSPLMFTVYIDKLIRHLQKSGIGCFIGQEYDGCQRYADDFVLLCPSVKGLQRMVDLCAEFGLEFCVTYNAKKTKCMKFELKPVMPKTYPIRLEGNMLEWTTSITHVGNYIRNDLMRSGINSVILLEDLMVF